MHRSSNNTKRPRTRSSTEKQKAPTSLDEALEVIRNQDNELRLAEDHIDKLDGALINLQQRYAAFIDMFENFITTKDKVEPGDALMITTTKYEVSESEPIVCSFIVYSQDTNVNEEQQQLQTAQLGYFGEDLHEILIKNRKPIRLQPQQRMASLADYERAMLANKSDLASFFLGLVANNSIPPSFEDYTNSNIYSGHQKRSLVGAMVAMDVVIRAAIHSHDLPLLHQLLKRCFQAFGGSTKKRLRTALRRLCLVPGDTGGISLADAVAKSKTFRIFNRPMRPNMSIKEIYDNMDMGTSDGSKIVWLVEALRYIRPKDMWNLGLYSQSLLENHRPLVRIDFETNIRNEKDFLAT